MLRLDVPKPEIESSRERLRSPLESGPSVVRLILVFWPERAPRPNVKERVSGATDTNSPETAHADGVSDDGEAA